VHRGLPGWEVAAWQVHKLHGGFAAAGCPSVVASQWSVDDAATRKLMVAFYQGLKAGRRKDEALREAMLAVKGTPASAAPVF
jgi:CHAT domain-containing protein